MLGPVTEGMYTLASEATGLMPLSDTTPHAKAYSIRYTELQTLGSIFLQLEVGSHQSRADQAGGYIM